jgi:hypothetical protein
MVVIVGSPFGSRSLKSTGTPRAKRCDGAASQGKGVHFREGRKKFHVLLELFLEGLEIRQDGKKPKQNTRSLQGGGNAPKQCPGNAQRPWSEIEIDEVCGRTGRGRSQAFIRED